MNEINSGSSERIFDVLSHPMRQALLCVLREYESTTVETVTGELVNAKDNRPYGGKQIENSKQVEMKLYHIHLPKMADVGIIDYDPKSGTIRTNDSTEVAADVLATVLEKHDL